MMNNVHNLPANLPTESPTEFVSSVIPSVKMTRHHFFLLCFNFFFHGNSLGISVCIYQFSGSVWNLINSRLKSGMDKEKIGKIMTRCDPTG